LGGMARTRTKEKKEGKGCLKRSEIATGSELWSQRPIKRRTELLEEGEKCQGEWWKPATKGTLDFSGGGLEHYQRNRRLGGLKIVLYKSERGRSKGRRHIRHDRIIIIKRLR